MGLIFTGAVYAEDRAELAEALRKAADWVQSSEELNELSRNSYFYILTDRQPPDTWARLLDVMRAVYIGYPVNVSEILNDYRNRGLTYGQLEAKYNLIKEQVFAVTVSDERLSVDEIRARLPLIEGGMDPVDIRHIMSKIDREPTYRISTEVGE